jgi:DNA topoisomerase-2
MSVAIDENNAPNVAKKAASKGKKTIEETYTKKTQLEHILLRPDTYGMFIPMH